MSSKTEDSIGRPRLSSTQKYAASNPQVPCPLPRISTYRWPIPPKSLPYTSAGLLPRHRGGKRPPAHRTIRKPLEPCKAFVYRVHLILYIHGLDTLIAHFPPVQLGGLHNSMGQTYARRPRMALQRTALVARQTTFGAMTCLPAPPRDFSVFEKHTWRDQEKQTNKHPKNQD